MIALCKMGGSSDIIHILKKIGYTFSNFVYESLFFLSVSFSSEFESCELLLIMSRYNNLNDQLASLDIEDEENAAFTFEKEKWRKKVISMIYVLWGVS